MARFKETVATEMLFNNEHALSCEIFNNYFLSRVQCIQVVSPSQPGTTNGLGTRASKVVSGDSPFKSKLARQPSKPCLECTCLGNRVYISLRTPPIEIED